MKWLCHCWIQPLQKRVREDVAPEDSSFSRAWSVVAPVLIYYVVNTLCISLFAYFTQWTMGQDGTWLEISYFIKRYSFMVSGTVNGLAMLAGAGAVYHLFLKETPQISLPAGHKKDAVFLVVLGAATALCFNVLFCLLQVTDSSKTYTEVAEKQFALPLWAGIILYGVVSPLAEEVVFRGLVYNRLRRQFGLNVAIIGSSAIFGLYHGNAVQALYGFILGVFMAVLYERYGAFIVPVLLHSAANICIYVISSDVTWQQVVLNPAVCIVSGVVSGILLWVALFYKKKSAR